MSEQNLEFLGYKGVVKASMPWSQPAESADPHASEKADAAEIHERFATAKPPAVEGRELESGHPAARASGFERSLGKAPAADMDPEGPEANEQLREQLEDRQMPTEERCLTSHAKRLLHRIKTALKDRVFGSDLEPYVKGTRTNGEAMQALEKIASQLMGTSDNGAVNPGKEQGLPNDVDADAFNDGESVNRGDGPQNSSLANRGSMLSPAMQKYSADRNAKQGGIKGSGGHLNLGGKK